MEARDSGCSPPTRASLLIAIRDWENQRAWEEFVELYTPVVFGYCRRRGLQDEDAADVAQESMRAVARAIRRFKYDPDRGKFRNWLLTVVRSKLNNCLAQRQRLPELAGETTLQARIEQGGSGSDESAWDAEYYRAIFEWAAERIRSEFQPSTWQAFWETTVRDRDGKDVAESLRLSVGAVYVAKSRVLARLKEEIQGMDPGDVIPPDSLL